MTNEVVPGSIYVLIAGMMLAGILIRSGQPWARRVTMFIGWAAILTSGFLLFAFRDDLGYVAQRVRSEATGEPVRVGTMVRVPMAVDGHFWVDALVNGHQVRFLVDSGATMTTLDRRLAQQIGIRVSDRRDQIVRTGNGFIKVSTAIANDVELAGLERRNIALHIADNDDLNVLGMNFLSSLDRWGVEGRWLVLVG